jgi:hypothetical protein
LHGRALIGFWVGVALFGAIAVTIGVIAAVVVVRDRIHDHRVATITSAYSAQLRACVRAGTASGRCSVQVYARCVADPRWNGDRSTAQSDCAALPGLRLP